MVDKARRLGVSLAKATVAVYGNDGAILPVGMDQLQGLDFRFR